MRPRALQPGDTVGICSPAGPVPPERLEALVARCEAWGWRVRVAPHALCRHGYLAGTDAERLADLNAMLADPGLAAVFCSRGGYGSMRLLPCLDYAGLARAPKCVVGFSDITALHLAIGRHSGLVTFHGPMAPLGERPEPADNAERLHRALTAAEPLGPIEQPPAGPPLVTIVPGRARGPLVGGNLTLIAATLGTPYEIDTRGAILLLEDVGEAPYRIDRLLTQLALAGKIEAAAGIVIGEMVDCEPPVPAGGERPAAEGGRGPRPGAAAAPPESKTSLSLVEVYQEVLAPFGKPILSGLACGHGRYCLTLPLGVEAVLDATAQTLVIEEAACAG
ncbi:MAG TPA: LD-carboxypeptidase [Limnochordia bacterium]